MTSLTEPLKWYVRRLVYFTMIYQVTSHKMNIEQNPITPGKYGIRSVPTLLSIWKGDVFQVLIGSQSKPAVENALKALPEK